MHPTGVVKPDDPDDEIEFLAEEALRSVRGLVSDAHGNFFLPIGWDGETT